MIDFDKEEGFTEEDLDELFRSISDPESKRTLKEWARRLLDEEDNKC